MENKVLAQNIEQIKHFNSNLANEILMFDLEKSNIQLAQNENGEYNILFNSIPLHSIQGAIAEARQIVQNIEDENNSIRLIYGFGLGYLADEFSNKLQKSKIVIYEENIDILKYVFSIAQFNLFSKENVYLCSNKEDLAEYISSNANENTKLSISFLTSYKNLYLEKIKEILNYAQSIQAQKIGDKNTFLKKAPTSFSYTLSNLKRIVKCPSISDIKNVYKGKTALITCAGPSLKENIELIKQNKDKFVIFALNPTIKMLYENDITPDFIVAIESANILKQFEGANCENSYFINEAFTHVYLNKIKRRKTFNYISSNNFLNDWVKDCLKITDNLETIGTVSYTALQSAVIMGFEKIILVGQDLAYKNGQCYSKECQWGAMECVFDENSKQYKIVVDDFEKFSKAFITPSMKKGDEVNVAKKRLEFLNNNLCTVKGQQNNYLPSQTGYSIFIKCFEEAAKKLKQNNPNLKLINSSIGGALIEGFEIIPLEKIVDNLEPIEKIDLESFKPNYNKEHIIEKISLLENDLLEYSNLINEVVSTSANLTEELKTNNAFSDEAIQFAKKFSELLSKISKLKTKEPINILVCSQMYEIENLLTPNCFNSATLAIEMLEKINPKLQDIQKVSNNSYKALCNSKSFILE
ncbi:MAG: motility associated factor glycosyltransferase family protein [Candidatus Gastranaerophilales bacterium]|nr:motility associated factor glycosyltransferase family protein [Candidatus Gastranaerophilales bacterium]